MQLRLFILVNLVAVPLFAEASIGVLMPWNSSGFEGIEKDTTGQAGHWMLIQMDFTSNVAVHRSELAVMRWC